MRKVILFILVLSLSLATCTDEPIRTGISPVQQILMPYHWGAIFDKVLADIYLDKRFQYIPSPKPKYSYSVTYLKYIYDHKAIVTVFHSPKTKQLYAIEVNWPDWIYPSVKDQLYGYYGPHRFRPNNRKYLYWNDREEQVTLVLFSERPGTTLRIAHTSLVKVANDERTTRWAEGMVQDPEIRDWILEHW